MNRRVSQYWRAGLLATLALLGTTAASAATVSRLELGEIRDQAVSVFEGQVVGMTQRVGETGKMVWRDYEINVTESFAGADPGSTATVSFAGGTVGGLSIGIVGSPYLEIGKHYLFFIEPGKDHPAATVGWGQGLYRIEKAIIDNQPRQILVSYDGEPLELSGDGRLMRGPSVEIRNGVVSDSATSRREDLGIRVNAPTFVSADGVVIPQPKPTAQNDAVVRPARTFATIDDVRLFIQRRLASVPERVHDR